MSIVRKTLAGLSAVAMLASATAATAQSVRPSDSLVSASSVSAVNGIRKNADLKKKNDVIHTVWILVFVVVGTVVTATWIAVDSDDDEPESP